VERESQEPEEEVISQSPAAGSRVQRGAAVTIVVSKGPQQVQVPDVEGLSPGDAARQLRAEGLGVARRDRDTSSADEDGIVVDQRPGGGSRVDRGRTVIIIVGDFQAPPDEEPPPDTSEAPGG
jgi:serine/threonine-protein kinase